MIEFVRVDRIRGGSRSAPTVVVNAGTGAVRRLEQVLQRHGSPPIPPLGSNSDWKYSVASGATPAYVPLDAEPFPSTEPATWVPWPCGSVELLGGPIATTSTIRPSKSGCPSSRPVSDGNQ